MSQELYISLKEFSSEEPLLVESLSGPNDDPTIIYAHAWWVANGIAPHHILKKKETA